MATNAVWNKLVNKKYSNEDFIYSSRLQRFSWRCQCHSLFSRGIENNGHDVGVLTHLDKGGKRNECLNGIQIHKFDIRQNILKHAVGEVKAYINFVEHYEADIMVLSVQSVFLQICCCLLYIR